MTPREEVPFGAEKPSEPEGSILGQYWEDETGFEE